MTTVYYTLLILLLSCLSIPLPANENEARHHAQPVTIHTMKKPSFKSKIYKTLIRLKGVRNVIDHEFETGDFSKTTHAAPIPDDVKQQCAIGYRKSPSGRTIWELQKKNTTPTRYLLYLHGGAFVHNVTAYDWKLLNRIVQQSGYCIVVPDFPLTPDHNHEEVYNMVVPLYEELLHEAGAKNLIVMGSSAGGGLALALAQYAKEKEIGQPAELILISPVLDATFTNPAIAAIEKDDPCLRTSGLKKALSAYAAGTDLTSYRISPMNGDLNGLAPVHLFMGTHELLLPDARRLVERAKKELAIVHYYEYEGMFHGWFVLNLPEARDVFNHVLAIMR